MFTAQTLGGSQQSFIPGGSVPRSNPLPEKVPLSYILFIDKWYPFHTSSLDTCIPFKTLNALSPVSL